MNKIKHKICKDSSENLTNYSVMLYNSEHTSMKNYIQNKVKNIKNIGDCMDSTFIGFEEVTINPCGIPIGILM